MNIVKLEQVKEYCDKHKVERNDWVAGAIDGVLNGKYIIQYRNKDNYLVVVDSRYIHSHMQSLAGFDEILTCSIESDSVAALNVMARKQAMLTIGELADDFEIGIA